MHSFGMRESSEYLGCRTDQAGRPCSSAKIPLARRGEFVFLAGEPATCLNLPGEGRVKVVREAEARIEQLQTERVEQRIAQVLLRLANKTGVKSPEGIRLGVPLSRQDLAELAIPFAAGAPGVPPVLAGTRR